MHAFKARSHLGHVTCVQVIFCCRIVVQIEPRPKNLGLNRPVKSVHRKRSIRDKQEITDEDDSFEEIL